MPEDKVMKKLGEHDKLFKKIDKRFEDVEKRFEENDLTHARIVAKLLEHDDEFEKVHGEIREFRDEIMTKMDQVLGVVNRTDQERYAMIAKTDRIEEKVETHDKDIKKMKKQLKLA